MSDNKKALEALERVDAYAIDMCSLSGNASTTYAMRKDIETILSALKALRDENKRLREALEDIAYGGCVMYSAKHIAQQTLNPKGARTMNPAHKKALEALARLGDSSSLDDIYRNELESIIHQAVEKQPQIVDVEGLKQRYMEETGNMGSGLNIFDWLISKGYLKSMEDLCQ